MNHLPSERVRFACAALVALVVVGAVLATFTSYTGGFKDSVPVTVTAGRAGLGLVPGSPVLLHGVSIGTVKAVSLDQSGGATLKLDLDSGSVAKVPQNTTASIDATSLFGPKVVRLDLPAAVAPGFTAVSAGTVLRSTSTSPEFNDVYQDLSGVLAAVDVEKLNSTLSNIAGAVDGRGTQLGELVTNLDQYTRTLNRQLPAIQTDIRTGARVIDAYAGLTPDLMSLLRNVTVTSGTLVDTAPALDQFLIGLTSTSRNAKTLVDQTSEPLLAALSRLRPVSALLARYAPEYGCTIRGLATGTKLAEAITGKAALQLRFSFLPAQDGYQYPRDLPKLIKGLGPDCYGLPNSYSPGNPAPRYRFDDGAANVWGGSDDAITPGIPPLNFYEGFFGPTGSNPLPGLIPGGNQ